MQECKKGVTRGGGGEGEGEFYQMYYLHVLALKYLPFQHHIFFHAVTVVVGVFDTVVPGKPKQNTLFLLNTWR